VPSYDYQVYFLVVGAGQGNKVCNTLGSGLYCWHCPFPPLLSCPYCPLSPHRIRRHCLPGDLPRKRKETRFQGWPWREAFLNTLQHVNKRYHCICKFRKKPHAWRGASVFVPFLWLLVPAAAGRSRGIRAAAACFAAGGTH